MNPKNIINKAEAMIAPAYQGIISKTTSEEKANKKQISDEMRRKFKVILMERLNCLLISENSSMTFFFQFLSYKNTYNRFFDRSFCKIIYSEPNPKQN